MLWKLWRESRARFTAFLPSLKGFDFLGYHFRLGQLSVAQKTMEQFVARAIRLYEQEPGDACVSTRFGLYVRRWVRWANAGLSGSSMEQKVRVNRHWDIVTILVPRL